jgi:hypothetical protein
MNRLPPVPPVDPPGARQYQEAYTWLFGGLPHVVPGQEIRPEHAIVLDAWRRAHRLLPWVRRPAGSRIMPTAAEVNEAIDWFNKWINREVID